MRFTRDEIAQILHETDRYDASSEILKLRRFLGSLPQDGTVILSGRPENVSGPRYGKPVSEDSGAMYPQEALDAAAGELARRTHGGAADPEDILLASNMLSAAFTAMRTAGGA